MRASGWPGRDRVVGVGEPFGELSGVVCGDVDRALPGLHRADHLAAAHLGALDQALGRRERTGGAGHDHAELRVRLVRRGGAVPGDRVAGGRQVVGRVHGDDLDALELALDQPGERAGRGSSMTAVTPRSARVGHAQVPAHRRGDLADQAAQHGRAVVDGGAVEVGEQDLGRLLGG